MVAFNNDFSSYARGSFLVVAPVVVFLALLPKILQAFASNSANRSVKASQEEFTFIESKINRSQSSVGTGAKVANIWHPFNQSQKSAYNSATSRSIMTCLAFRLSYKPVG